MDMHTVKAIRYNRSHRASELHTIPRSSVVKTNS